MTSSDDAATPAHLAEYAEPDLYDLENPDFDPDGPFYLALAQHYGGPVLDLGCGTGRITIPLARAGIDITGLDLAPAMLERARAKAADLAIPWVCADVRQFALPAKFELILDTGSVLQHVLERSDHEAILARVRQHLAPAGRVLFHTFAPHPTTLVDMAEHDWFSYDDGAGRTVHVSGAIGYEHSGQIFHENAIRRWRDADGQEVVRYAPLARRMFFPQELELLLHYNGFNVEERYGDWERNPISNRSQLAIFVCSCRPSM